MSRVLMGLVVLAFTVTAAAQAGGGRAGSTLGGLSDAPPPPPPPPPPPGPFILGTSGCVALQTGHTRLRGHATADDGRALGPLNVQATNLDSRKTCGIASGEDGTYEFTNLPVGHYRITIARAREYFAIENGRITVGDAPVDNFDFHFVRACTITGRVVDTHDQPVANMQVRAMNADASVELPGDLTVVAFTDAKGEFRLTPLLSGSFYVVAEEPTAGPRALAPADRGRYQPTYFPGTVYPFDRRTVAIGPDNPGEIRIVLVAGPKF